MATIPSISQQHQVPFEGYYQINFGQGGFSGICTLGLRMQPPHAAPAVPQSPGAPGPLEMSPGVISCDGEQPQTLSACSHGPEQGSSQLEGFSRLVPFVRSQQGLWELDGSMRAPAVGMGSALILGLQFCIR